MNNDQMTESVLAVAEKLFGHYGIEKTSMDDIAKAAHKSKRSLYNYFTGKEDIFRKVLIREMDDIRDKANEILDKNIRKRPCSLLKAYLLLRPELIRGALAFCQVLKTKFQDDMAYQLLNVNEIVQEFNHWEHSLFQRICEVHVRNEFNECESANFALAYADMMQMALQGMNYAFFVEDKYEQYKVSYTHLVNVIIDSVENKLDSKKEKIGVMLLKINRKSKK